MHSILLAGVQSGCGKTTATLALMQYFINQGLNVRGFKSGPDFLDPLWHQKLTGNSSYNLDTKMVGIFESQKLVFSAQKENADIAIIEGVMGLFDGRQGIGREGSSAHLAQSLDLEVCLVVDAKGISGSIVPLVSGFVYYAKKIGVTISAIIANRLGSQHHADLIKQFLNENHLPPLIAWLDKKTPKLPERHLGLIKPDEYLLPDFSNNFHIEVDNLLTFIPSYKQELLSDVDVPKHKLLQHKNISIAYDAACCFIYPANIDWLESQGAIIQYFSPIAGDEVPENTDALWLPGGYPELYAEKLSKSLTMSSLKKFMTAAKPVLAECGGMMILGETLIDQQAKTWNMAGILPIKTTMQNQLACLGYRECMGGINKGIKGHEFHHSTRSELSNFTTVFPVSRGDKGIQQGNIRASYIHWYFSSAPGVVAKWFGQ